MVILGRKIATRAREIIAQWVRAMICPTFKMAGLWQNVNTDPWIVGEQSMRFQYDFYK